MYQRSFRRPVKIRVETEPPRSADWIAPLLPAGVPLLIPRHPSPPRRPLLRVIRSEPAPPPDWRIVGDHELALQEESEASGL